jgi:hypothetical protein
MLPCTSLAVVLAVTLSSAAQEKAKTPEPGDTITLAAAYGQIPAFRTEEDYRDFLRCVKAHNAASIATIKSWYRKELVLLKSGDTAVVIRATKVDGPEFSASADVLSMPPLVVRKPAVEKELWVPAIYARGARSRPHPAESKYPVLIEMLDRTAKGAAGMQMYAVSTDETDVAVAKDASSFGELAKAAKAGDEVGFKELAGRKKIALVKSGTPFLVIERHQDRFIGDGSPALEGRVLDGPLKDQTAWILEANAGRATLGIMSYQYATKGGLPKN